MYQSVDKDINRRPAQSDIETSGDVQVSSAPSRKKKLGVYTGVLLAAATFAYGQSKARAFISADSFKGPTQNELKAMNQIDVTADQETAIQGVQAVINKVPADALIRQNIGLNEVATDTSSALEAYVTHQTANDSGIVHVGDKFKVPYVDVPPSVAPTPPAHHH